MSPTSRAAKPKNLFGNIGEISRGLPRKSSDTAGSIARRSRPCSHRRGWSRAPCRAGPATSQIFIGGAMDFWFRRRSHEVLIGWAIALLCGASALVHQLDTRRLAQSLRKRSVGSTAGNFGGRAADFRESSAMLCSRPYRSRRLSCLYRISGESR